MASDLEFALALADQADRISGRHFAEGPVAVQSKPDGSPVTAVDVEIEQTLREMVLSRRPGDGFLGEEVGQTGPQVRRWIVDGIDGTHSFASGQPGWGTLVALEEDGEAVLGVASSPGQARRWWAIRGEGAWSAPLGSTGHAERLEISAAPTLSQSRALVLPPPDQLEGWRHRVATWVEQACPRPSAHGHGALLVAAGDCDLSVHLWGGPWDHAPFAVIVEEAGGRFANLWGDRRLDTLSAVFGARTLVDELLDRLNQESLIPDLA